MVIPTRPHSPPPRHAGESPLWIPVRPPLSPACGAGITILEDYRGSQNCKRVIPARGSPPSSPPPHSRHFGQFRLWKWQNHGDSARSCFAIFRDAPKSSKMVIPPRVAVERGGDVWESPFCHFQSLKPPKWAGTRGNHHFAIFQSPNPSKW